MRHIAGLLALMLVLLPSLLVLPPPVRASHLQTNASANTTAALNLRASPSRDAEVIRVIPEGSRVFVVSSAPEGHWYEVTYQDARGYVFGDFLVQNQIFLSIRPESGPPGTEVTIFGSGAEPGERIDVLWAPWDEEIACRTGRGAELVATVTANEEGRFRTTHTAQKLSDDQVGITYTANDPRERTEVSTLCFTFSEEQTSRFFPETNHTVSGEFLEFWQENGGLPVFGYPITEAFREESLIDGQVYLVQYFQRQRFELHPENPPRYRVLLGLLGQEALPGFGPRPRAEPINSPHCTYFEATGHNVCWGFRAYWQNHGLDLGAPGFSFEESLALFGYPISEAFEVTTGPNNEPRTIQYFERARFEYHPENPEPFTVLLGLLGREVLDARYGGELPEQAR